ncbi:hypothetical protein CU097_007149 [Rhizopus azygosporus]|uniref:Methyltransferase domain-containing protein n=1 Tax=Rhizopus azygosporus TaxID=86630 RepID=A0A367J4N1_RHIAZ|nr:hypothetical protein CU097_007149 [Rhizopus azygosporus]CEG64289.1 hypothetical protein RMATCC62417_01288 [Rhizopus microsporus]
MGNCFTKQQLTEHENNHRDGEGEYFSTTMIDTNIAKVINSEDITLPTKREFHQIESSTYWLPKDDDEQMRLTGQHFAFKDMFGGNILRSVTEILDLTQELSVLDVGCGPGVWSMDMITDYPNCRYEGCDMVDVVSQKPMPKQFTFNIGNVLDGLPYPDNTFDLVHLRLFTLALQYDEWPGVIKELLRVIKPGGLVQIMEADIETPKENKDAFCKAMTALTTVAKQRHQNPRIGKELERLLREAGNTKIVETKSAYVDTTTKSDTAKRIAWAWLELLKGAMPSLAPVLELKNHEEQQKFLKEVKHCMATTCGGFLMDAVIAQKL